MGEGGPTKGLGTVLIVFGALSIVFGVISIPFCVSDAKYVGAPIWSGIFIVLTGAVALMSGYRSKSNGWMTASLVMSILAIVVVFTAIITTIVGVADDKGALGFDHEYDKMYDSYDEKDEDHYDYMAELLGEHLDLPDGVDGEEFLDMFREFMDDHEWPDGIDIDEDELNDWFQENLDDHFNLPEDFNDDFLEDLLGLFEETEEDEEEGHEEEDHEEDDEEDDDHEEEAEDRHLRPGDDHDGSRPRPGGDEHHEPGWMDYDRNPWFDDDYSSKEKDWDEYDEKYEDFETSIALFAVSFVLAFVELVLVFSASITACCGLCKSTRVGTLSQAIVLQPGQQILPGNNGQFVIVHTGYGEHSMFHGAPKAPLGLSEFTPSTNPALTVIPTGPPTGRLPPLDEKPPAPVAPSYEEAVELPTKISL